MANPFGYAVVQTDNAGTWFTDGYVSIGATGAPTYSNVPSGIVNSIVRNSTGNYSIILNSAWYALLYPHVVSVIPSSLSPAYVSCQIVSSTVGNKAVLPKNAGGAGQAVVVQFNVAGTPTELPSGSGFDFFLHLKQSSA